MQIRGQALHMLQVLPTGRLVWVQRLGRHCWEDDDLVIASQVAAEDRWHAEQVGQCRPCCVMTFRPRYSSPALQNAKVRVAGCRTCGTAFIFTGPYI